MAVLAVTGCHRSDTPPVIGLGQRAGIASPARAGQRAAILERVPADTPYVFAALDPLPADAADSYLDGLRAIAPLASELRAVSAQHPRALAMSIVFQLALLEQLNGPPGRDSLVDIGLDPSTSWAIYGLGRTPVVRIQLSDAQRFARALAGIGHSIGARKSQLDELPYYQIDRDGTRWVLAIRGQDLIASAMNIDDAELILPTMLGNEPLIASLAGASHLERVAASHGFQRYGVGYLHLGRLFDQLAMDMPDVCRDELDRVSRHAPRIVFGYHSARGKQFHLSSTIELSPAMSDRFANIAGQVPGADPDLSVGATLTFAVAIDARRALSASRVLVDDVAKRPFACPALKPLSDTAATLQQGWAMMTASPLTGIRGLSLMLFEGDSSPIEGLAFVASDRPGSLLALAAQQLGITLPKIEAGDPPETIKAAGGLGFLGQLHVALSPTAVGVAVGDRDQELAQVISQGEIVDPPLVFVRVRGGELDRLTERLGVGSSVQHAELAAIDRDLAERLTNAQQTSTVTESDLSIAVRPSSRGLKIDVRAD